jgi:Holliday junction resolvasome RuvABC ATP-dependent DNA helicase subunit
MSEPLVTAAALAPEDDDDLEVSLRPRKLEEFVGQPRLKE